MYKNVIKVTSALLICLLLSWGGVISAKSGAYDYSGDFSQQLAQNCLDRDYLVEQKAAYTTRDYAELEGKYVKLWDKELNAVYQKVLARLDVRQRELLVNAQAGWLQWHINETEFVRAGLLNDRKLGTLGGIQEIRAQKDRLRERTLELMEYYYHLGGTPEFEYQGQQQP